MNAEGSVWLDSPAALITSAEPTKPLLLTRPEDASPEEIIGALFYMYYRLESKGSQLQCSNRPLF